MTDFRTLLAPPPIEARLMGRVYYGPRPGIKIAHPQGALRLSIQASRFSYCEPREDALALSAYVTWELAVLAEPGGAWLRLASSGWDDVWRGDDVAGYVPTERVQQVYDALASGVPVSLIDGSPWGQAVAKPTAAPARRRIRMEDD